MTVNIAPRPMPSLATRRSPPWAWARARAMVSPIPLPPREHHIGIVMGRAVRTGAVGTAAQSALRSTKPDRS